MNNLVKEINTLTPIGSCVCNKKFLIYTTKMEESPHIVLEIGRLRKLAFEAAGVKISSSIDLDEFDTEAPQQSQMLIWDTEKETIVGAYRYSYNHIIQPQHSPMGDSFLFSEEFSSNNWIQLGRGFLSLDYQKSRYGIFCLMNGLGCLFAKAKNSVGFFGKVTVPESYELEGATNLIVAFCKHYWLPGEKLGTVKVEHERKASPLAELVISYTNLEGKYKELGAILDQEYKMSGLPILRIYDYLANGFNSIYYLGAFIHQDFGGATEIGMAISKENFSEDAYNDNIKPYM